MKMDWSSFFIGAVAGVIVLGGASALLTFGAVRLGLHGGRPSLL